MADRRRTPARHHHPRSLVASAAVMAQHPSAMTKAARSVEWQEQAWTYYDSVGELRFGVGWVSNAMSRVNLVAAIAPEQQGDEPTTIEVPDPDDLLAEPLDTATQMAVDLVAMIAGGPDGQGQLLGLASLQLSVPGVGYLLAVDPNAEEPGVGVTYDASLDEERHPVPADDWEWRVLSVDEVRVQGEVYEIATGPGLWEPLSPDALLLRFWRPHPRRSWEPDSPCRAVLPVLRQIAMLDEHVAATAQSRLAGAGLLVMPAEAEFAPLPGAAGSPTGVPDENPVEDDDFVQTLVDTMTLPISDRGSAAAVVPLTVRIPGEFCDKVQHVTFWSEFNDNLLPLRESAVKRLALGLDMPPEVLTGMAGMNHWGAWQVEETAITLHCEPQAETLCQAFTVGFLRPALRAAGHDALADRFMVWYDTTDLTTRPDRSADAIELYDRMELSGAATRREAGLSDADAPDDDEYLRRITLKLLELDPAAGAQLLARQGVLESTDADLVTEDASSGLGGGDPVEVPDDQGPPPGGPAEEPAAVTSALLEACDGLVFRALERAGGRLRSAAGRAKNGGAAAIPHGCDPSILHTQMDATRYDLDGLLEGAWTRCTPIAGRYGLDGDVLTRTLDTYTRALLATGHAHDLARLSDALGLVAVT